MSLLDYLKLLYGLYYLQSALFFKIWRNQRMAIKKYRCRINYLHGCEFFDVIVKANSERKARIRAKDKVIKERGNNFCMVCGCEEITEESSNGNR